MIDEISYHFQTEIDLDLKISDDEGDEVFDKKEAASPIDIPKDLTGGALSGAGFLGLAKSDIQMDVGKAMQILGFPYQQTFESTSSDDITTAFLNQTKRVMKKRQDALEKSKVASGYIDLAYPRC